jgi:hypothetical protein
MQRKRTDETEDERLDRELDQPAIATIGAILLVADVLRDGAAVVIATVAAAVVFVGPWLALGIMRRIGHEHGRV